jgi:hypothetical protein
MGVSGEFTFGEVGVVIPVGEVPAGGGPALEEALVALVRGDVDALPRQKQRPRRLHHLSQR